MANLLPHSPVDRGIVSTYVAIVTSFCSVSGCFLFRARLGRTPRQREEDLVQRRRAERDVVGRDAHRLERAERPPELVRAGTNPNADPARRLIDLGLAL